MSKVLILIFFNIIILNGKVLTQPKDYAEFISKAENSIIALNYDSAYYYYNMAFVKAEEPFGIDIHNALVINNILNRHETTLQLTKRLFLGGASLGYFKKDIFNSLRANKKLFKNIEKQFINITKSKNYRKLEKKRNTIINELNKLNEEDQKLYCKRPDELNNIKFMAELHTSVSERSIKLSSWIDNGELNERTLGINFIDDTTISTLPQYFILIRHAFQEQDSLLISKLYKAREYGQISTEVFAMLLESIIPGKYTNELNIILYKCKFYGFRVNLRKDKLININRRELGLSSMEDLRKKILFKNTVATPFFLYGQIAVFRNFDTKQNETNFLESTYVIHQIPIGCN